ncbi:phosphotransferase family protein [Yinghuangia sp. YIM S09857]|uniref:phosphotransferase family protein n=1 Tax=Yinghuangia sp. YIM S09857 TaxID=3436929 RepID=UPI003F53371A
MSDSVMPVTAQTVTGAVRAALGSDQRVVSVRRLPGGSGKAAYRLGLADDSSAVAYIWQEAESHWPESGVDRDESDPFAPTSSLALFDTAHRHLCAVDARVPEVYLSDDTHTYFPADLAIVEDIRGPALATILRERTQRAAPVMERLAHVLDRMHAQTSPAFGRPAAVARGRLPQADSCAELVLERARTDLAEAAERDRAIAVAHDRLAGALGTLYAAVAPRTRHSLVHGELAPEHVLVDVRGEPVLIGIEGLMFFDAEWEHVFLRLRYDDYYSNLHNPDLDETRMAFYGLAIHLSLAAGPLRLVDGDLSDRDALRGIVDHNLDKALRFAA